MQTPAEIFLVQRLASFLAAGDPRAEAPRILDVGAGRSISIEKQLSQEGCRFISDRIDIEPCEVQFPTVRNCWQCPVEDMSPVESDAYAAVFANYVIEHVENLNGLIREVSRVLTPGGIFIATLPNPAAPEFIVARHTPLWFHKLIRRDHGWETHYAYAGIPALIDLFIAAGFHLEDRRYWPYLEGYLWKYPLAGALGKLYDKMITGWKIQRFMGNVCLVFRKPDPGTRQRS
jgi:SAM-dependent methyltransferase